jgi:hypothetical protein
MTTRLLFLFLPFLFFLPRLLFPTRRENKKSPQTRGCGLSDDCLKDIPEVVDLLYDAILPFAQVQADASLLLFVTMLADSMVIESMGDADDGLECDLLTLPPDVTDLHIVFLAVDRKVQGPFPALSLIAVDPNDESVFMQRDHLHPISLPFPPILKQASLPFLEAIVFLLQFQTGHV